jgi:hypothetical protein
MKTIDQKTTKFWVVRKSPSTRHILENFENLGAETPLTKIPGAISNPCPTRTQVRAWVPDPRVSELYTGEIMIVEMLSRHLQNT